MYDAPLPPGTTAPFAHAVQTTLRVESDADGDGQDDRRLEVRGPHCGDLHYQL
jgi:hypothetical protein